MTKATRYLRLLLGALMALPSIATVAAEPIRSVEIGRHRELRVNGQPFLPVMLFAQSRERIADGVSISANVFAAGGGRRSAGEYLDELGRNGLYGVMDFNQSVADNPYLLGWIHGDEPDLPTAVSDANIQVGEGTTATRDAPLWRIVDGNRAAAAKIEPLEGGEFTIKLEEPATAVSLAITLPSADGRTVAKDVQLWADGKELLQVTLQKSANQQKFDLPQPVTFSDLTVKIVSVHPGEPQFRSIAEVEAFDKDGVNFLMRKVGQQPRRSSSSVIERYAQMTQAQSGRPVFMTLTGQFFSRHSSWDEATRRTIYPAYVQACDVVGFDIYPIFGTNYPSHLDYVADAVEELVALAGPRPVFAWIETNKGSRWVSPEKQLDVLPMHTRAEVWMAIIRGATAIGYFTHTWVPAYKQFAPEGEMVAELNRLNRQLTRLAPVILAEPAQIDIQMSITGELPCHFKATQHEQWLYIFAQNIHVDDNKDQLSQGEDIQPRGGAAAIAVQGLKAGTTVEVVDENRTITAGEGKFSDHFEPLGEHVYRLKL